MSITYRFFLFFFFFQAEDGIRDLTVTGVQTCALPISRWPTSTRRANMRRSRCCARATRTCACGGGPSSTRRTARRHWPSTRSSPRSEERRVGEEGRSRWAADHLKKKKKENMSKESQEI